MKEEIKTFLSERGYEQDYWFFKGIMMQESTLQQFASRPQTQAINNNFARSGKGYPYFGFPDGFGIMQVDRQTEKTLMDDTYLWDWKRNIDKGKETIDIKVNEAAASLRNTAQIIERYTNGDITKIVGAADQEEGNITFSHHKSEIEVFSDINAYLPEKSLETTTKSFIDADLIRRYNGGVYYLFNRTQNQTITCKINITNKSGHNYVASICSKHVWSLLFCLCYLISCNTSGSGSSQKIEPSQVYKAPVSGDTTIIAEATGVFGKAKKNIVYN